MRRSRTLAVIIALQGVLALLKLQSANANVPGLLLIEAVYAALACLLWKNVSWAALLGALVTLPQLVLISSQAFTWSCFVGLTFGLGLKLPQNGSAPRVFTFGLHGVEALAAHGDFVTELPGTLGSGAPMPCHGLNFVAGYVLVLLFICWRERWRATNVGG